MQSKDRIVRFSSRASIFVSLCKTPSFSVCLQRALVCCALIITVYLLQVNFQSRQNSLQIRHFSAYISFKRPTHSPK